MTFLVVVSLLAALIVLPAALYLGLLGLMGWREARAIYSDPGLRFVLLVPAHDEQASIAATVESLRAVDYPPELRHVVVVADNCEDRTAAVARAAGAVVLERRDPEHRGKGFALDWAFRRLLEGSDMDAVVVIDADTVVSRNLLTAFAARLHAGAHAVQAEYGVRNVDASWRTRLMTLALALFHRTRSSARSRMGLSVGLRGNGMCFSRELLEACPHEVNGLVEDLEYGVHIGLRGYRVAYAGEAYVLGEMVTTGGSAVSQRRRWERGRALLARAMLLPLMGEAIRQRSATLVDLAIDLAVPPLSTVALGIVLGLALDVGVSVHLRAVTPGLVVWGISAIGVLGYVARGVQHSGLGAWRAIATLGWAPAFVLWKLVAVGPARRPRTWVRTQREAPKADARP
jgi:GT2 family glycosyltransferase